jgi:flagellar hook protein FlgE
MAGRSIPSSSTTTTVNPFIVNYNNGQTRTIAQVPVITFNVPNTLQSQNGRASTALLSGTPSAEQVSAAPETS